jgi:hypothetical protein
VKTFYLYHGTEEVEESGMRFFFIAATFATTCKLVQKEMRRRFAAHHIHLQFISSGTQITKLHRSNFISALVIMNSRTCSALLEKAKSSEESELTAHRS